jgi:hypothetical protein
MNGAVLYALRQDRQVALKPFVESFLIFEKKDG